MSCFVSHTSLDCRDAHDLSRWWEPVLGYRESPEDPNEPGDEECAIHDPATGHTLLFLQVRDPAPGRSRMHLDLRPRAGTRDAEVERLLALGATLHEDHRDIYGPGSGWVTLADPEGNLLCVLRSEAEVAAAGEDQPGQPAR